MAVKKGRGTIPDQPQDNFPPDDWPMGSEVISSAGDVVNHRAVVNPYRERGAKRNGPIGEIVHKQPGNSGKR